MDVLFGILNQQSPHIQFTREAPCEEWLPFLNTQIKISHGAYSVKWYRKSSSKNIIIHAKSAHPKAVKRAVLKNMYRTAIGVSSGNAEREESRRLACEIARHNGYTTQRLTTGSRSHSTSPYGNKTPLLLPFISDKVSAAIQQCLIRADLADSVVLVTIQKNNLKRQLVRNRLYDRRCTMENCVICPHGREGDCAQAGVIYQIQCSICGDVYIGETGRVLGIRMKEHLACKRRSTPLSPLGKHRVEKHDGEDFNVICKVLAREDDIGSRKALEAFWIRARSPAMNNRNECMAISADFLPFIPLCGL